MLDSRLRFLTGQAAADEATQELAALATTGRFGLQIEGVDEPRVRVLAQVGEVSDEQLGAYGLIVTTRAGDVVAGDIALSAVTVLDEVDGVTLIEAARPLVPELDASLPEIRAAQVHTGPPGLRGAGVIIGIIDSGIDWRHSCFRDGSGHSRVLRVWDQTLVPLGDEESPQPFGYGVEYQQNRINAALAAADPLAVCRSVDGPGGHGTHVAGIAAGDGSAAGNGQPPFTFVGVAPEADIVLVANQVTTEAMGDSATTFDAVRYIFDVAQALGRPAVINLSQGDNLGPHDGTSLLERGIDNLLGAPGRAMVKSAGNAAGAGVHASGTLTAGVTDTVRFLVPANDVSVDTLDFWYAGADRVDLRIVTPDGTVSAPVAPGSTTSLALANGNRVFVDSVVGNPNNGDNRIYVQLRPGTAAVVQSGSWAVSLTATEATDGRWHGWIERGTSVPQFVGPHRNDQCTISVPGTSAQVITAASYITKGAGVGNISTFSSRGPTRDGRPAPTVAAPGQQVMSANSGAGAGANQYLGMSGTSMAAPHVTGAIALLLQAAPDLTQRQLIDRLSAGARTDVFTGGVPNRDWGAGKVDTAAVIGLILDDERAWITALYADLLGRTPDQAGLDGWLAARLGGLPIAGIAGGLLTSAEYTTAVITRWYACLLHRAPDPGGLQYWTGRLTAGAPEQDVVAGFLDSAEYRATNAPPEDFVHALYGDLLGRDPDVQAKQWIDQIAAGGSTGEVVRGFLASREYATMRVTELYAALLGRSPDPQGLEHWVGRLAGGTRLQDIQLGFLTAEEYRERAFARF